MRRKTRDQRGRTFCRVEFLIVPVRRVADAAVPVRVVGLASRFDVPVGRGCWALRPVAGTRCCCDRVVRRSGGLRDSVTPGV